MTKDDNGEAQSPQGLDISDMSLGALLRHLSIGSWATILGLLAAIFWAGYRTPEFLNQTVDTTEAAALMKQVGDLERNNDDLKQDNFSISKSLEERTIELAAAEKMFSETDTALLNANDRLKSCTDSIASLEANHRNALEQWAQDKTAHDILKESCSSDMVILASVRDELQDEKSRNEALQTELAQTEENLTVYNNQIAAISSQRNEFEKRYNASLLTVYTGDGGWQGARDAYAPCGTPVDEAYGRLQCNAREMDFWYLKSTGTVSGGACGHSWYALLCQQK